MYTPCIHHSFHVYTIPLCHKQIYRIWANDLSNNFISISVEILNLKPWYLSSLKLYLLLLNIHVMEHNKIK